ncbi:sigma-70 family RNA polymerase sigma factor [Paenibacillus sp. WLX1005]|uniref:sigma-70 family RNA polymerase sigma factor n=1 Tax=Paenibacillus sp. WLX1005 TaxID=3243766 RepID=UPI0039843374
MKYPQSPTLEQLYEEYYTLLTAVAYRMTGSHGDAEDMVQDVFARLTQEPLADITHIKAYLIRAVTNRSLNLLQSARKRRELYPGPWLPEPNVLPLHSARHIETASLSAQPAITTTDAATIHSHTPSTRPLPLSIQPLLNDKVTGFSDSDKQGTEQLMLRQEEISYAVMVMLEQLTPVERAIFVLRESFELDYSEIASYVHKSEAACRKILSRIRSRLQPASHAEADDRLHTMNPTIQSEYFASAFLQAARSGNFTPLLHLLQDDVRMYTDGGGKVRAAIRPILTRYRVTTFLQGIAGKGAM